MNESQPPPHAHSTTFHFFSDMTSLIIQLAVDSISIHCSTILCYSNIITIITLITGVWLLLFFSFILLNCMNQQLVMLKNCMTKTNSKRGCCLSCSKPPNKPNTRLYRIPGAGVSVDNSIVAAPKICVRC